MFTFDPTVDMSVKPAITFFKRFVDAVKSGAKSATMRRRLLGTWKVGAKLKARWYPQGHGAPAVFGTVTITEAREVLVRDFDATHVTNPGESLCEYMKAWVVKGCGPCTCGRWAALFAGRSRLGVERPGLTAPSTAKRAGGAARGRAQPRAVRSEGPSTAECTHGVAPGGVDGVARRRAKRGREPSAADSRVRQRARAAAGCDGRLGAASYGAKAGVEESTAYSYGARAGVEESTA